MIEIQSWGSHIGVGGQRGEVVEEGHYRGCSSQVHEKHVITTDSEIEVRSGDGTRGLGVKVEGQTSKIFIG